MSKEIVGRLPLSLAVTAQSADALWVNTDFDYRFAFGGIPFLSAVSDKFPYDRATTPWRKEQQDASNEPGEQSFSSWWLRSQSSFHGGAGINYYEPPSDDVIRTQFQSSAGVNPWVRGELSLLRDTTEAEVLSGTTRVLGYDNAGTPMFLVANSTTVKRHNGTSGTSATWGGSGSVLSMCQDGTNGYIADSTGIYRMVLSAGSGSLLWNTGSSRVVVGFAKQRLVAGIGASIYELVGTGPGLPTATYTHPNSSWTWTSITEGPDAIYAAGYAGNSGAIFRFDLNTDGSMPTLTSATVAAEFPTGEVPHAILTYLGSYMAIGTSAGLRIAVLSDAGDVQYGPLTVETTHPVRALAARDRFIWAGVREHIDGNSGLVRVDLSAEVDPLRFAYANDLSVVEAADVDSVSLFGTTDRMVIGCSGAWLEAEQDLVTSGYLVTGQVRYSTLEYKQFVSANVRADMTNGGLNVAQVDDNGTATSLLTLTSAVDPREPIGFYTSTPEVGMGLKFTLTRDVANTTAGPVVKGWQMKALPHQVELGDTFQVPMLMLNFERDPSGRQDGYETWAYDRFRSLKQIERNGTTCRFQDLAVGESLTAVIEEVRVVQTNPQGWGGICLVTARQVRV